MDTSKLENKIEKYLNDYNYKHIRHKQVKLWTNTHNYKLNTSKKRSKLKDINAYVDFYLIDHDFHLEVKGYNRFREREFSVVKKLLTEQLKGRYEVVYNFNQFIEFIGGLNER